MAVHDAFAPLTTRRLGLRLPTPEDARWLEGRAGDWRVARYTAAIPHPYRPRHASAWIAAAHAAMVAGRAFEFVCTRRRDGVPVGTVSLHRHGHGNQAGEIGYWIDPHHWGRGYATEAAARMVDLAFDSLHLDTVWAAAHQGNPASSRVLAKAGLHERGRCLLPFPARRLRLPARMHVLRRNQPRPSRGHRNRPVVFVAAACLIDDADRLLVARRPPGKSMAGLWEFPGGKIERCETPAMAASRELSEELGVEVPVLALMPVAIASHAYPRFHLLMPLLIARDWAREPRPREGQEIAWVTINALRGLDMPPADAPLIDALEKLLF